MNNLIQETLSAFQKRDQLNSNDGFNKEKDIFNEILLESISRNLDAPEYALYQKCRETINRGLEQGRAGALKAGLEQFRKIEAILCSPTVSYPCKLLIAAFYSSGLAYLRLKEYRAGEAEALSLQALAIDNYLIQEHGYHILEMHRVQQVVNLARIQMATGLKEEAFRLLFALIRCFENQPEFPAPYRFSTLGFLKEQYAEAPAIPAAVGLDKSFFQMGRVNETPVTRFGNMPGGGGQSPLECRFLLDFSALPFEVIQSMLDQIIVEFIRFTKGLEEYRVTDILYANGLRSVGDLTHLKIYESAYLFLAIKIHAANDEQEAFLNALKSFCEVASSQPIWNAIVSDFYGFCMSSREVERGTKEQVRKIAGAVA
ncbi:MAG: hypothetical protein H6573_22880 [Lewinellaceae bacterium]|nr:hypothetical protein [Lewinellaceae bacterium]